MNEADDDDDFEGEVGKSRINDPATSDHAAALINVETSSERVLKVLYSVFPRGLTCQEIALRGNIKASTVSPRMPLLQEKEFVVPCGTRCPPGHTKSIIYKLTKDQGIKKCLSMMKRKK